MHGGGREDKKKLTKPLQNKAMLLPKSVLIDTLLSMLNRKHWTSSTVKTSKMLKMSSFMRKSLDQTLWSSISEFFTHLLKLKLWTKIQSLMSRMFYLLTSEIKLWNCCDYERIFISCLPQISTSNLPTSHLVMVLLAVIILMIPLNSEVKLFVN